MQKRYFVRREAKEASIKEVFANFIKAFNIDYNPFEYEVKDVWKQLTGTLTDRLTKKIYIQGSVLYVFVSSPALKQELMLVRTDLLGKINKHFADKYKQYQSKNIINNIIIK
ncbi:MAG: DUF721 domain-containing protein [Bacteroidales bacterium]|jgi:predicted nucleic acid-binding Zn ribbon protein|nr:DUF721 domain-containing protein [Bacteroidales bacterium]